MKTSLVYTCHLLAANFTLLQRVGWTEMMMQRILLMMFVMLYKLIRDKHSSSQLNWCWWLWWLKR